MIFDEFIDAFLDEAIESRGLAFGGGGRIGAWDGFVCRFGCGSAGEDDRDAVRQWLERQREVEHVEMGDLVDAWYTT